MIYRSLHSPPLYCTINSTHSTSPFQDTSPSSPTSSTLRYSLRPVSFDFLFLLYVPQHTSICYILLFIFVFYYSSFHPAHFCSSQSFVTFSSLPFTPFHPLVPLQAFLPYCCTFPPSAFPPPTLAYLVSGAAGRRGGGAAESTLQRWLLESKTFTFCIPEAATCEAWTCVFFVHPSVLEVPFLFCGDAQKI